MFNLSAIHDVNTGIILTVLVMAYFKCRQLKFHAQLGLLALMVFVISILPTPIHGTGIWGIVVLLTTYTYLYRIWGIDREITILVLVAILLMMLNVTLGFKLRGAF